MSERAWTNQAAATEGGGQGRVHGSDINLRSRPQMAEYEAAADRIVSAGHLRVLDWGCGYGQMSKMLAERGAEVTSIDWDPEVDGVISRPLIAFGELESLATNDPVLLPFDDASFDAVLSMGVLEHVQDPDASLDELQRVLAPGALLYCYKLPNRLSYLEAIARRTGMYYHGQLENDRLYTPASARAIFERHGFEIIEVRRANMLPLTLSGRAATATGGLIWRTNRILAAIPGLNTVATNVEVIARSR